MPIDRATGTALLLYLAVAYLPGQAMLKVLRVRVSDPAIGLGLAVGVGLALQPLVWLWSTAFGVPVTPALWWAILAASAVVVVAPRFGSGARLRRHAAGQPHGPGIRAAWPHVALAGIGLCVVASRWWAVRGVSVPLWGDSLHHTMIARLFTLARGVPHDWLPLAPLSSFTYHFGLHAGVATLSGLGGLPEHRALLVAGQALSVLQVLTAYALAAGLTRRPWAGVLAALAAGGISTMPAYYVNWGRYTQLAGQVLLPAAALALVDLDSPGRRDDAESSARGGALAAAVLAAGLALTHYLVLMFLALFWLAWLVVGATARRGAGTGGALAADRGAAGSMRGPQAPPWRMAVRPRWQLVRRAGVIGAAAVALTVPWLPRMADSLIARAARRMVGGGLSNPDVYGVVAPSSIWGSAASLQANVGLALLAAGVVAAVWAVLRRERVALAAMTWIGLLALAAYPGALGLPITAPIKDFTLAIGLYVPLGLAIGAAGSDLPALRRPTSLRGRAGAILALLVVLAAAGFGWRDAGIVRASNVLVTPADERAMAWIRSHTPAEAFFLVGCVDAFGDSVCAGDDAGWWIPLLADRRTTVPPITYSLEQAAEPGLVRDTNHLADLWRADLDAPETRRALADAGVTHAYVGATGSALPRQRMADSPWWRLLYQDDGAAVYARSGTRREAAGP